MCEFQFAMVTEQWTVHDSADARRFEFLVFVGVSGRMIVKYDLEFYIFAREERRVVTEFWYDRRMMAKNIGIYRHERMRFYGTDKPIAFSRVIQLYTPQYIDAVVVDTIVVDSIAHIVPMVIIIFVIGRHDYLYP